MTAASPTIRIPSAGQPSRIARALAAAAIVVAAAPLLVIVAMLVFGSIVGTRLTQTATEAVTWAASVALILTLLAVFDLLLGIIAAARVLSGDRFARALLGALRATPRLLIVLLLLVLSVLVLILVSPLVIAIALLVAFVLRVRGKQGVRRALIAAIPLLPALVALAMIPASIAAAIGLPRSIRALLASALAIVRTRKRRLLAFTLATAALSTGLSWAGTTASGAFDAAGHIEASLLALTITLAILMVGVGAAGVLALPPRALPPREAQSGVRSRRLSRVAVAVTTSIVVSLLPLVAASPASAVGLAPVLSQNFDALGHTVTLSANVAVVGGDPNGVVQFFDGTTAFGAPVHVTRSGSDPDTGTAPLPGHPTVSPGDHSFSFTFTPDSSLVLAGSSSPRAWHVTATTLITLSADAAADVGGPADVTVTLEADYATTVTPTGTVLVEWDTGSADVALVGGVGTLHIPELLGRGITATYSGSADFTAASTSIEVGVATEPVDTEISATVYSGPHPLGGQLDAVVSVLASGAPYGTVVRGGVQVYADTTLLTENASWVDPLVIPTTALHAGTVTLRFVFVPHSGFNASETREDVVIQPAATSITAVLSDSTTLWGEPLTLALSVGSSADGERTVEVRNTRTDTVVATQTVDIAGGVATATIDFATSLLPATYDLVATVLADADHATAASSSSHSVVGAAATTTTLTFSTNPVQTGQPVTLTATTTATATGLPTPLPGKIYFQLPGGPQEEVPLIAGSATFVWTPTYAITGNVIASYFDSSFRFASSSKAQSLTIIDALAPSPCVYPTFRGPVDLSRAVRCGTANQGIRAGSTVTISQTPHAGYVIDYWTINGQPIVGATGATLVVRITSSANYGYSEHYAPVCYTLTLSPLREDRATTGGYVSYLTRPNCSSPLTATSAELADAAAGHSRYAAGTTVEVLVTPNYVAPASGQPELAVDSLSGATFLNDQIAQLVMNGNRAVSAVFKVKTCTPVSIFATEGGTVAVTKATRPGAPSGLQPATGECTTGTGAPGYVPGTKLTFTATPDADTAIFAWNVATTYPYLAALDTGLVAVGTTVADDDSVLLTKDVVVPADTLMQVAAHFAQVKCVSVTVVSREFVLRNNTINEFNAPKGATSKSFGTEVGCGGIATKRVVTRSGSGWYRIVTETTSYVAAGRVDVSTTEGVYRPQGYNEFGPSLVLWSTSTTEGVDNRLVYSASTYGPSLDLAAVPPQVTVNANWVLADDAQCFAPHVSKPQGGSFILEPKYADEPFCEDPGKIATFQELRFRAASPLGAPALIPVLTGGGGVQYTMPATFFSTQTYVLEYCAPFTLDVRLHNDSGGVTTATADEVRWMFDDDGGCPQGWTRPNRTLATAISGSGAVNYTVIGNAAGFGPTLSVDALGVVTGANRVDLQVMCFSLTVSDASITTAGNCPGGGSNRFLRGTQVQVQAGEADRFDGWYGVDAEQGESAWVIMGSDRSVSADLHNYSVWEKASNALSSVAQRAASAVVTLGTGLILSQAYLVKSTAWILTGTASILRAVGINGSIVDGIDKAGQVVFAQFDALSLLATCMNGAATGDGAALLTVPASGTPVPSGDSADDVVAAAKAQLADQLSSAGVSGTVPLQAVLGKAGSVINVFGSGLGGYSADASSSWGTYGSSIGSCMQRGAEHYVETTYH